MGGTIVLTYVDTALKKIGTSHRLFLAALYLHSTGSPRDGSAMLIHMDGFSGIADSTGDVGHQMTHVKFLAGRRWQGQKVDSSRNCVIKFCKKHPP